MLLDGSVEFGANFDLNAFTLVEQSTTVGTTTPTNLNAGDFLISYVNGDDEIKRFQPGDLGSGTTLGTLSVLVDGSDFGMDVGIRGLELIESDVTIGDTTLTAGQLLVTLNSDDNAVGGMNTTRDDIFLLEVTDTGTTSAATATTFFQGDDVGINTATWNENPWGLSLVSGESNLAPTLGDGTLSAVNEDTASPAGEAVSTIFSGQFSDADAGSSMSGIAVVGNTANAVTEGTWQYSTNGGTNWFDIGTVADDNTALAISSATLIRFVPVADYNGSPTGLTVRGLDNTYVAGFSDTAGSETRVNVDTTNNGGTTAIAPASASLDTSITSVNDSPIFIEGSVGNWNFDEGSGDSTAESAIGISTGTLGSTAGADANDPTWTTGKFGQALHFDGVNDYVEIADAPGIDISGPRVFRLVVDESRLRPQYRRHALHER